MRSDNKRLKLIIVSAMLAAFLGSLGIRLTIPTIAFYAKDVMKVSKALLSLFFAFLVAGRAFSSVVSGYAMERFRWFPKAAPISAAICALAMYCYVFVSSWWHIVAIRFVQGVANGIAWPSVQILLAFNVPERIRGRVFSVYFALGTFGIAAADVVYYAIARFSYVQKIVIAVALYLLAAACIAVVALLSKSPTAVTTRARNVRNGRGSVLKSIPILACAASMTFVTCFSLGDLCYVFVVEKAGVSEEYAALVIGVMRFAAVCISYVLSWIADIASNNFAIAVSVTAAVAAAVLLAFETPATSLAAVFLALSANSSFMPLSRRFVSVVSPRASRDVGLLNASQNVGNAVGQVIFGSLYGSHVLALPAYAVPALAFATVLVVSTLYLLRSFREV